MRGSSFRGEWKDLVGVADDQPDEQTRYELVWAPVYSRQHQMFDTAPDGENWLAESKPWEPGLTRWKSWVTTLPPGIKRRRRENNYL